MRQNILQAFMQKPNWFSIWFIECKNYNMINCPNPYDLICEKIDKSFWFPLCTVSSCFGFQEDRNSLCWFLNGRREVYSSSQEQIMFLTGSQTNHYTGKFPIFLHKTSSVCQIDHTTRCPKRKCELLLVIVAVIHTFFGDTVVQENSYSWSEMSLYIGPNNEFEKS